VNHWRYPEIPIARRAATAVNAKRKVERLAVGSCLGAIRSITVLGNHGAEPACMDEMMVAPRR